MNNSTLYPSRLGSKAFVWQVLAIKFLVHPVLGPADFISDIQGVAIIPGQMGILVWALPLDCCVMLDQSLKLSD